VPRPFRGGTPLSLTVSAADATLNALLATCYAQPDSRTPFAILADYLEEQGDSRSDLLRHYLQLWAQAEALPIRGLKQGKGLDLSFLAKDERRLRYFACLCVRLTPLPGGVRAWEVLKEERSQRTIVVAELYEAELVTIGELQQARLSNQAASGAWLTLAARHAAWTPKTPGGALRYAKLAADCVILSARTRGPGSTDPDQAAAIAWQQHLLACCAEVQHS
jgi:uncharacterized protein (TIGR02996 family)